MATRASKSEQTAEKSRSRRLRKGEPGKALVPARSTRPGGRPLGQPNVLSRQAKDNIVEVFSNLGGVKAMTTWAKKNKDTFYTKLYARLIPKDVSHSADAGLEDLLTQLAQRAEQRSTDIADGDYVEIEAEERGD